MEKQPWMRFYPQDWRSDEKLRLCSLAARGLWIEMLAIMHRSERYGQLLISGRVPTDAQLAVQVGAPPDQVSALVAELEEAGVFSRAAGGAIYSRRMTRDQKKAAQARKNGKKGGNPKLSKTDSYDNQLNLPDKPPDKGGDKPQKPEARGQRPEASKLASAQAPPGDEAVIALRKAVCGAYLAAGNPIPPDTGQCAVWLAQGYPAEICLAVIRSRMPSCRDKRLKYFDKAIAEAVAERPVKAHALAPAEPKISLGYGSVAMPESNLRRCIEMWIADPESWSLSAWGPYPPENPAIIKFAKERGIELKHVEAAE